MATRRPRLAARNPARVASGAGPPGPPFAGSPWQGQRVSSAVVTASNFPVPPATGGTQPAPWTAPNPENFSTTPGWGSGAPRLPRHRPRRNYLDKKDAVKAPKSRQNGTLLVFDPKEKVMIDPSKPMSQKEASSKKIEDKVSLKSTENKPSSRSVENKDVLTNRQSDPWSSSYLKESAGEAGKDSVLAKQEKVSEYCLQDVEEKLSDSTDGDGEEDTNDEDEEGPSKKETRAPLELMAEFLRAEMGRDYQLAKKLCQMILIYEPENPVAKEFFSLIEEILLKEKAQKREEDDEDSEEATSSESDAESSEDGSEDSSDECEDGS